MTIRHFRVFNEVCKCMNMTQASKSLHVSQPSISKTIVELEDWYQVKLFERIGKKLFLTDAGKLFYKHSQDLIETYDRIDWEIRNDAVHETLRIGASVSAGTSILSDLISSFQASHPDIQYLVHIENTQTIRQLILNNELDIALIEGTITDPNLISECFATAEVVAVCSQKHPFYFKEELSKEELMHASYIVREPGSNTRMLFETAMQKLQISWTPTWICSNTQAIKNATAAGHGIGVLSKLSVRRRLLSGEFKRIPIGNMRQSFYIVYQKDKLMSKLLSAFKQHIIQSFDDINL